jgi:excisionase family DNA binding protein
MDKESLSPGEAARELGVSLRSLQRLCSDGRLPCFYTPGGQIRVARTGLEAFRDGSGSARGSRPIGATAASGAIQSKRETIETLTLEMQERRARRELRRMEEEDAEPDRRRTAAAQAEEYNRRAVLV